MAPTCWTTARAAPSATHEKNGYSSSSVISTAIVFQISPAGRSVTIVVGADVDRGSCSREGLDGRGGAQRASRADGRVNEDLSDRGCACTSGNTSDSLGWLWLGLLLAVPRSRRQRALRQRG
ncbi:MYXO-CTERM sorting domain-containing protein [Paraliomyxa miuraensis]|uniref:MYXO-CTERM sorting domain-containing protein n=1 Tax=Paraliomyxa miuraensis TaxID=376150 RepID=UPI00389AAC01